MRIEEDEDILLLAHQWILGVEQYDAEARVSDDHALRTVAVNQRAKRDLHFGVAFSIAVFDENQSEAVVDAVCCGPLQSLLRSFREEAILQRATTFPQSVGRKLVVEIIEA